MSAELSGHLSHPVTYTVANTDRPDAKSWSVVETCEHHTRVVCRRLTEAEATEIAGIFNGGHLVDLFDLVLVTPQSVLDQWSRHEPGTEPYAWMLATDSMRADNAEHGVTA